MNVSIAELRNRLSALLKEIDKGPISITRHGKTVGMILSTEVYQRLRRVEAYLELLDVSREVREGPSAGEIYRASRAELEERP